MTLNWRAEDLWLASRALVQDLSIEVLGRTGSTNADAFARLRGGDVRPCLIVAETQTAGRGRQGRPWFSAPGASLTFSLALGLAPRDWGGLSLAMGLALAEALDPVECDVGSGQVKGNQPLGRIGVKWPNDLWLRAGERKLAGILIETAALPLGVEVPPLWPADPADAVSAWTPWPATGASAGGARRHVVIGVGINIAAEAPTAGPADSDGASPYASGYAGVQEVDERLDAPATLARVVPALLGALRAFERDGFAPLREAYAQRDLLLGRPVQAGEQRGRAAAIDADGSLLLELPGGAVQRVVSGEVSVRPC
jgi:BirA family biotin operon repressor/biotin-[acetyl-CoA-carboxylase] ligase